MAIVLVGFEECGANKGKYGTPLDRSWTDWIVDGFIEQNVMSMGRWKYRRNEHQYWGYPDVDWNSAPAVEFFGPGYKNSAYREGIQKNLDRHSNLDYAYFLGWHLHVRCDDPADQCLDKATGRRKGITEAYTLHDTDDRCSPYQNNINFCPIYFDLPKLGDAMSRASSFEDGRNDLRGYYNRACTWAHEVMHVSWLSLPVGAAGSWMQDIQIHGLGGPWNAYRVLDAKYLSYSDGVLPTRPFNNPQNYAYYMLAGYIKKLFDWYPSEDIWYSHDDPPVRPPQPAAVNATAAAIDGSGAVTAISYSCTPLNVKSLSSTGTGTDTSTKQTSSATRTTSAASSSTSCFVPAGCTNAAAPTGCAVACA